jgi:hypothetical protein
MNLEEFVEREFSQRARDRDDERLSAAAASERGLARPARKHCSLPWRATAPALTPGAPWLPASGLAAAIARSDAPAARDARARGERLAGQSIQGIHATPLFFALLRERDASLLEAAWDAEAMFDRDASGEGAWSFALRHASLPALGWLAEKTRALRLDADPRWPRANREGQTPLMLAVGSEPERVALEMARMPARDFWRQDSRGASAFDYALSAGPGSPFFAEERRSSVAARNKRTLTLDLLLAQAMALMSEGERSRSNSRSWLKAAFFQAINEGAKYPLAMAEAERQELLGVARGKAAGASAAKAAARARL